LSDNQVNFCVQCGAPVVRRVLFGMERATCPHCGWIHFEDPKVAVAVVIEENGYVLLTQRANEPFQGWWSLPAGFVNAHEDPTQAAIRECLEETGLHIEICELIGVVAGREHDRGADIVIAYRGKVIGGDLAAGDDASGAAFFPLTDLPQLVFRASRVVLGLE
jgi:ADP-ribose pyrophosphatase YjhB (NUDIX family)